MSYNVTSFIVITSIAVSRAAISSFVLQRLPFGATATGVCFDEEPEFQLLSNKKPEFQLSDKEPEFQLLSNEEPEF
ncbi:18521_t:CDS:2 [Dentiscutata erythropus]|uniref:18521_t:CDS:1 n=1 Tax=Dentiscutata erythropus TaxID=1348616 RepID=A0A9N9GQ92_9GLOM|nr:18521_t:CDS:2 [Dentiscutata erythropus]